MKKIRLSLTFVLLLVLVTSCVTFPVKKQLHMVREGILNCTLELEAAYQDGYIASEQYEKSKLNIERAARLYNRAVKVYEETGETSDELHIAILILEEVEEILIEARSPVTVDRK